MNHFYSILWSFTFSNILSAQTQISIDRFKLHWTGDKIIKESAKQLRLNLDEEEL